MTDSMNELRRLVGAAHLDEVELEEAIRATLARVEAATLRAAADDDELRASPDEGASFDFNRGVDSGTDEVFDRMRMRAARLEASVKGSPFVPLTQQDRDRVRRLLSE